MNSEHSQKALWLTAVVLLVSAPARADFDLPGVLTFDFAASGETLASFEDVGQTVDLLAECYLNTSASAFGDSGVLIWAGFVVSEQENRRAVLLIDLDLAYLNYTGSGVLNTGAVRVSYLEKVGDEIVFRGQAKEARVKLVDVFFSGSDQDALELSLELLISGEGNFQGGRALVRGSLSTIPTPDQLRGRYVSPDYPGGDVYVDSGCSGDVYIADNQGCACGGEDDYYDHGSGCEGDSAGSGGGCEGDTSSTGSGCGGDTGGSGCEGDASAAGSCSDSSSCTVAGRRGFRLRALPQIAAVGWLISARCFRRRKTSRTCRSAG